MKKHFFLVAFFISSVTFSQGEANNWVFGYNAGINFSSSGAVSNISNSSIKINTEEGCSIFSDSSGNLLFYSDGETVWNSNHDVMENGKNLRGHPSSTQSAMIIPKPLSTREYYIFTVGSISDGGNSGFNYYTVDMAANAGLGKVASGPVDLSNGFGGSWTEKVAAVKGDECNTFWVVSYQGGNIKSYKIDPSGVNPIPVISPAPAPANDRRGYLKISPNGKKLAIAHYLYGGTTPQGEIIKGGNSSIILYDFNDLTGKVTNPIRLFNDVDNNIHPYGLEFSRQSSKLYASAIKEQSVPTDRTFNLLYQYDLESINIIDSKVLIHTQVGYRGALQIGLDGKIYATVPVSYLIGTQYLDVINNPDKNGINCDYREDVIDLGSGTATQGLPPFISSIFSPIEISGDNGDGSSLVLNGKLIDLCIGDNFTISPEPLFGTVTYKWIFNNITIATSEKLVLSNISLADIGDYNLEVTSTDICNRSSFRNGNFSINTVNEFPVAFPTITQTVCDPNYTGTYPFDFDALFSSTVLSGQDPSVFEVKYFSSQGDADANINQLPVPYNSPNVTVYARIQNRNNNNCYATTSFDVNIAQAALPLNTANINPLMHCDNTSIGSDIDGLIVFDLTQRETEILNGQSANDFKTTYFTASNYHSDSEILDTSNFTNTVIGGQTIYVRITNNVESSCFADTSFVIEVFELPVIQPTMTFKNCDEDGGLGNPDGFTDYNLDEANDYITNGDTSLTVTYHLSIADANAGSNVINPSPYNNATASTVYARVQTTDGCHRVSTISLQVSTTTFRSDYSYEIQHCDDDNTIDGLHLFDLSEASPDMLAEFPSDQNLSVHYYRSLNDAQLEMNEILSQTDYINEVAFNQTIYVRVESDDNGACFDVGPYLTLTVHPRPEFEVIPEAVVCLNLPAITLEAFNAKGQYSYEWTDESNAVVSTTASVEVAIGGVYTVIATSGLNCQSFPQTVTVSESDIAIIDYDDVTITDDSSNNLVSINNENNNLGIGDYEFSLDDEYGPFQDESFFEMVIPGIHTIYVRDKNSCGISPLEISVIGFPKFFTPNDDGYNDNWQILGVSEDFYPSSLIYIFNRFGKILAKIDPLSSGWNGYYNGVQLPSDDYWFSVQLIDDKGNIKNRKGHFSLIRR